MYYFHVDFYNGERGGRLNGWFTETSVIRLLEASGYDSIDSVGPFMEAMVSLCYGLGDGPVTNSYTQYLTFFDFANRDI